MSGAITPVSSLDLIHFWGWSIKSEAEVTQANPFPKRGVWPMDYHRAGHQICVHDHGTSFYEYGADRDAALKAIADRLEAETCKIVGCVECGRNEARSWDTDCEANLKALGMCFNCAFWHEKLAGKDAPQSVRVEGRHFWIEPDQPGRGGCGMGHGGSKFDIRFHDGRKVVSRNLWAQGDIPNHFKARLPDNAVFEWER